MLWLRKSFLGFLALVFFFSLLGGVVALGINNNLGSSKKVEKLLSDSKVYDRVIASALDQSQNENNQDPAQPSTTVSLKDQAVKQAAKQVFTPELLKNVSNSVIDANFNWLSGKTPKPEFTVDLTQAKQDFAKRVGDYVTTRLAGLPPCSALQQAQLGTNVDPLSIDCRPAGVDPTAEGAKVAQEISTSDFLSKPVVTPETLGRDQQSQEKPYYQDLAKLPKLYQIGQKLPWILSILALLTAAGIAFVSPVQRKGWRRIGIILLEVGVILVITAQLANSFTNQVEHEVLNNSVGSQLNKPATDTLKHLESNLSHNNLWFGVIFILLASAILIYLYRTREGVGTTKPSAPDDANPTESAAATSKALPKPSKPQPKKPPRLVQ